LTWFWTSPDGGMTVEVADELRDDPKCLSALLDMNMRRRTSALRQQIHRIEYHALTGQWPEQDQP
jgi:hypothetical protein